MNLRIKEGYCYQVMNSLMNVTTANTANALMKMAHSRNVRAVDSHEASCIGFEELAEWAIPEKDMLYLIDDYILVCLPKEGEEATKC